MGCLRHLPEFFTIHQTVDRRNLELRQKVTGCGANVVVVGGLGTRYRVDLDTIHSADIGSA